MIKKFAPGALYVQVSATTTSDGLPCVQLAFDAVKLRIPLGDAETLAEALVRSVREAEKPK